MDKMHIVYFLSFSLSVTFHMFINIIITGREKSSSCRRVAPGNVSFLIMKCSAFSRRTARANCGLLWMGQLLIVSWIGGPSRSECQPYWLSLITPHGGVCLWRQWKSNQAWNTPGTGRRHGQRIVMISHLRTLAPPFFIYLFIFFCS